MTLVIEFNIEDEAWFDTAPSYRELALRAAEQTLAAVGRTPLDAEISVLLCADERIAALNADFRGKPTPTNVLSWPAHDLAPPSPGEAPPPPPDGELGDIALARETVEKEAKAQQISPEAHFAHLFAHGVLHLLGYDHETEADAEVMEGIERRVMAGLGLHDPYPDRSVGAGR
ncbi:MAG: rRNA maturation RNase YbeY [Pseudomonadota bacterium]